MGGVSLVQRIKTSETWAFKTPKEPKVTTWYVVSIMTWFSVSGLQFSKCCGKRTGSIDGQPKETFLDSNGIKKYEGSSVRSHTFRGHVSPVSDDHTIRSDTPDESRTHAAMSREQTCSGSVMQEGQLQAELIHGCIICRRPGKSPNQPTDFRIFWRAPQIPAVAIYATGCSEPAQ